MKKTFITVLLLLTVFVLQNNSSVFGDAYSTSYHEKEIYSASPYDYDESMYRYNNHIGQAEFVENMNPVCYYESCSSYDEVTIYGTIHDTDSPLVGDYYMFFVEEFSNVDLLMINPSGENYDLYLYKPIITPAGEASIEEVSKSINYGDSTEFISLELEAGLYYLHVKAYSDNDFSNTETYSIRIEVEDIPNYYTEPYILEDEKGYLWCDNDLKEFNRTNACQSFRTTINGVYTYEDMSLIEDADGKLPSNIYTGEHTLYNLYDNAYQLDDRVTDQMLLYNKESVLVYGYFTQALYREINLRLNGIEDDIERISLILSVTNTGMFVLEILAAPATGGASLLLFTIDSASLVDIYENYLIELYVENGGTYASYTYSTLASEIGLSDDFSGDIDEILTGKYFNDEILTMLERYLSFGYVDGMRLDLSNAKNSAFDAAGNWKADDIFAITVKHNYSQYETINSSGERVPEGISTRMETSYISSIGDAAYSYDTKSLKYTSLNSDGEHEIATFSQDTNLTRTSSRMMQNGPDLIAPVATFNGGSTVTFQSNNSVTTSALVSKLQPVLYFNNRPDDLHDFNHYYSTISAAVNTTLYDVPQLVKFYIYDDSYRSRLYYVYVIVEEYIAPPPPPTTTDPKPICIKGICIVQ